MEGLVLKRFDNDYYILDQMVLWYCKGRKTALLFKSRVHMHHTTKVCTILPTKLTSCGGTLQIGHGLFNQKIAKEVVFVLQQKSQAALGVGEAIRAHGVKGR